MKYHYTYMTTNTINNKIYIGVHSSNKLYDSYMGSGKILKRAIKKHGKENFMFTHLEFFNTRKEAMEKEGEIVTPEFISFDYTYNLTVGGFGFPCGKDHPQYGITYTMKEETKEKLRLINIGKTLSETTKNKISKNLKGKNFGENNPMYGVTGINHPKSKAVRNFITGIEYGGISEAGRHVGLKPDTLRMRIINQSSNNEFEYI